MDKLAAVSEFGGRCAELGSACWNGWYETDSRASVTSLCEDTVLEKAISLKVSKRIYQCKVTILQQR